MLTRLRGLLTLLVFLTSLPVAAAGRELAPRGLAPTSYGLYGPSVAFAGGRFLTVWREHMREAGVSVMAALSDAEGRRISPRAFPLDIPAEAKIYATGAGDEFALFWPSLGGAQMALVDREGHVTAVRPVPLPRTYEAFAFGWNGTHFLAVVRASESRDAEGFLFDREGRAARPPVRMPFASSAFDVAVVGGRLTAFGVAAERIFAVTITPDEVLERSAFDPLGRQLASPTIVAEAKPDGNVLLVWSHVAALKSAIYSPDGGLTTPAVIATGERQIAARELLRDGDGYVVAFSLRRPDETLAQHALRLDANGARVGDEITIEAPTAFEAAAAKSSTTILAAYETVRVSRQIMSAAVARDAQTGLPEVLSIRETRHLQPALAAGGGRVFAAWTELAGPAAAVRATTLNPFGEPQPSSHIALAALASRDVAWNGVHHLVVHRDLTRLMASRVDANGRVFDEVPIAIAPIGAYQFGFPFQPAVSVVWSGERWLVLWASSDRLLLVSVSAGGLASPVRELAVHLPVPREFPARHVGMPVAASDGRQVLLVWRETWSEPFCGMPGCSYARKEGVFAALLGADGAPIGGTRQLELPIDTWYSVASSGTEFMVVAGTHAAAVDVSRGFPRIAASREVFAWHAWSHVEKWNVASDVTWDGRDYVVALRYLAASHHLAVLRLDREANRIREPRGIGTLASEETGPPSVAAAQSGEATVALQEAAPAAGGFAVAYQESELPPVAEAPGAPRNVRVRALRPSLYELTWDAPAAGAVDAYAIEVWADQEREDRVGWITIARVPSSRTSVPISGLGEGQLFRVRAVNAGGASAPTAAIPLVKRRSVGR